MTELEQIRALASQGVGRLNAEAMIGRHMTPDIEISCRCRDVAAGRERPISGASTVSQAGGGLFFMVKAEKVSVYTNYC